MIHLGKGLELHSSSGRGSQNPRVVNGLMMLILDDPSSMLMMILKSKGQIRLMMIINQDGAWIDFQNYLSPLG